MKTQNQFQQKYQCSLFFTVLLLLGSLFANAQHEPQFTQYMFNETFINPAYAGSHEGVAASVLYRNQWVGIEGSPKTETFSIHTPALKKKLGLGLSVMGESIGVTNQLLVSADFAYRIVMPTSTLAFGLQGGFVDDKEDYLDVHTIVAGDNQFAANVHKYFLPNAGFGIYYYKERFYAGFSIPRLLENKISPSQTNTVVNNIGNLHVWHYYLASGYVFDLSDNVKFKPSVMIKAVQNSPTTLDANINFLLNNFVWLGAAYRTGDAVAGIVGLQLNPQFRIGYSYDYTLSDLQRFNAGSHEFTLSYDFGKSKTRVVSPRYF